MTPPSIAAEAASSFHNDIGFSRQLREIYETSLLSKGEVIHLFQTINAYRRLQQQLELVKAQEAVKGRGDDLFNALELFLGDHLPDQEATEDMIEAIQATIQASQDLYEAEDEIQRILSQSVDGEEDGNIAILSSELVSLCAQAAPGDFTPSESLVGELRSQEAQASRAKQRLMAGVQQYVVKIARRYMGRGLPLDDLVQEGNIGLMKAIDKFDPDRGFAFLTYANDWIKQSMGRACTNYGSQEKYQMRIPCHMYMAIGRVRKHWYPLSDELEREPNAEEISERCDISLAQAQAALEVLSRSSFSLDANTKAEDSDSTVADFIPDEQCVDPLTAALEDDQNGRLSQAFRQLTEEEQKILLMRLDLGDRGKPATQETVCRELGIKKSRMLNIQRRALNKLRASLENQKALVFFD